MTNDARTAMEAWQAETCPHQPPQVFQGGAMDVARCWWLAPDVVVPEGALAVCEKCLADLFARLQEAEALRAEWQQRCSEPLVIHFQARSVHALSRPCPLCPNPTLDAALAGTGGTDGE